MNLSAVPLALLLDALIGDPPRLWRRTGHPVTWMGAAIAAADRRLNTGPARRLRGALALLALLALFVVPAFLLARACAVLGPAGIVLEALLACPFLAHRSLHEHVAAVAAAPDLDGARRAVAMVVGRDVTVLDESGVSVAALETLSESFNDAVVAPTLWFALGGLPGIVAYKLVNTADSMIGHRTARHGAFGFAAARLDDLMNLVPARLAALLALVCAPGAWRRAGTVLSDAPRHVSPNAGWPETAFAVALGVRLGGPRRYGTRTVEGAVLNAAGRPPDFADIRRGLALSRRTGLLQGALYAVLAVLVLAMR